MYKTCAKGLDYIVLFLYNAKIEGRFHEKA